MAEQMKINLNTWNGGMSNDEYAGGSFFYGENVNIRENSKSFKLSSRIQEKIINYRTSGEHNKIIFDNTGTETLGLSNDGYIEGDVAHYEYASNSPNYGGYLYKRASGSYLNGIIIGSYLIGVTSTKLDAFNIGTTWSYGYGLRGSELVANPDLNTNDDWAYTVGRRTFGATGAVHSPGGSGVLEQTITPGVGTGKISIYVAGYSAGTLEVSYDGSVVGTIQITTGVPTTKRYTFNVTTSASDAIILTASSDFNGTVGYVDVRKYDATKIQADVTLTTSSNKPLLYNGGILYIGSGNKVEILDTSIAFGSFAITTGLQLALGDDIIGITKIGRIFYIYCNNGQDGVKYMRDGITTSPQERVIRKHKKFISVDGDGNQDYAICGNTYKKMLYITNGYSKQLINQSKYMSNFGDYEAYRLENRFDFDKVIGFEGDICYITGNYGIYTYGTYNPGLPASTVKEWAKNTNASMYYVKSMAYSGRPVISYRTLGLSVNYNVIAKIRQYNYNKKGYMVTNPLVFDNLSTEKILKTFKIGYLLPSSTCSINIYAKVNDRHYYTFYVNGLTTTPTTGAIYTNYNSNVFTVIKTSIVGGAGTITCITELPSDADGFSYGGTLTKTSGTGDASITYTDRDNRCLIRTITTDKFKYSNDYIYGEDFISSNIDNIFKIQFKIELISTSTTYTPEIYDIPVLADTSDYDT